jgi:orotidine-5'-phosphate decarboxylase
MPQLPIGTHEDASERLIVALDTASLTEAEAMMDQLAGLVRWFKIGPHLFTAEGPRAVRALRPRGKIFLDLKFHDIPSVVAAGVAAAARLGVSLCTVHALGGRAMMAAAKRASDDTRPDGGGGRIKVLGVTLLTSVDAATLAETGFGDSPRTATVRLARLARDSGLDGVIAAPPDAATVREACGLAFLIVSPGIRPAGAGSDDQRRTAGPAAAIAAGADMLVVGRAITRASDVRRAAADVLSQIAQGTAPGAQRPTL